MRRKAYLLFNFGEYITYRGAKAIGGGPWHLDFDENHIIRRFSGVESTPGKIPLIKEKQFIDLAQATEPLVEGELLPRNANAYCTV